MQPDIPLHDIKPMVEIVEPSLYYFLAIVVALIALLGGILFLLYRWYTNRSKHNIRALHVELLNSIDMKESKKSAYAITLYGATFKDDSPQHLEIYSNINSRLESFKYKKDVESIDSETLGYVELYKGMIDA